MKKLFVLLLSVVLVCSLAACGNKKTDSTDSKETTGNTKVTTTSDPTDGETTDPTQNGTGGSSAASGGDLVDYPVTDGDIVEDNGESVPSSNGDLNN